MHFIHRRFGFLRVVHEIDKSYTPWSLHQAEEIDKSILPTAVCLSSRTGSHSARNNIVESNSFDKSSLIIVKFNL